MTKAEIAQQLHSRSMQPHRKAHKGLNSVLQIQSWFGEAAIFFPGEDKRCTYVWTKFFSDFTFSLGSCGVKQPSGPQKQEPAEAPSAWVVMVEGSPGVVLERLGCNDTSREGGRSKSFPVLTDPQHVQDDQMGAVGALRGVTWRKSHC